MRKIISLTLATAMVASMAVSAFAAETAQDSAVKGTVNIGVPASATSATVKINGDIVTGTGANGAAVVVDLGEKIAAKLSDDYEVMVYTTAAAPAASIDYKYEQSANQIRVTALNPTANDNMELGDNTTETTVAEGAWQSELNAIFAYPYALVESGDWNGDDGVKPGCSIYFMLHDDFKDVSDFKFDVSKGENAKQIKKVSVVEKKFGSALVNLETGSAVGDTAGRHAFVKVELADNMTDKEYKVSFDFKVKVDAKDGVEIGGVVYPKGTTSRKWEEIGATWVYNVTETTDDREFMAGEKGIMVKPVKNEENTVLWTDQNRDLARITFTADSDVAKYFPKLSTKWPNATYAQLFDDQDAFVFDFVGNPKISSTSRAVLELFCPFVDDEDEYTVDPESVVIYQVADDATLAASTEVELAKAILDGRLIDVTDKFTAGENEDGDFVYTTKTRTLGTYIIAEKAPSEEAFEEAEGEAPVEEPTENTEKPNPGTGR